MILQDKTDKVERIGGGESHQFSIHVSRKAFQILSDLYSDKPLAIVRELACNALDSHISAGKADLPISIHLPNSFEPYLEIRDFGTGISREDVFKIYSSYFTSTKTNSNDAIGCLGLGSKSPFCYTDNFTVTSRHNGTKSVYLAYFDEGGAPTLTLAEETPDTEGNGVTIQIPVKAEDYNKFIQATKTACKWFKVKPTVIGADINWSELEGKIALAGNGWRIMQADSSVAWHTRNESYAIMGGVNYKIDASKVDDKVRSVLTNLIVDFNIGELDFAPSREALSYDPRTISALNAKLAMVREEIAAKAKAELNAAKYLNDAARVWIALPSFARAALGQFFWKNKATGNIRASHRALIKRSYRQNLYYTKRDVLSLEEMAVMKGCTFVPQNKTSIWKIRAYLNDNSTTNTTAYIVEDDVRRQLIAEGIDPACFTCTSTLKYAKATLAQKTFDKEVVGLADSSYARFDSVNLQTAIKNGAKYYALKEDQMSAKINGLTLSKDSIRSEVLNTADSRKLVVFVAPTKEKMAVAAGLKPIAKYLESRISELTKTAQGQRYAALLNAKVEPLHESESMKLVLAEAKNGKSNLAEAIRLGLELDTLSRVFSGLAKMVLVCKLNLTTPVVIQKPKLSELERFLFNTLQYNCYRADVAPYRDYEALYEKTLPKV